MSWLKEPPPQDPDIRKRWINWKMASVFGLLFVLSPVAIAFVLETFACQCDLGTFVSENGDRYWQLILKFTAFGILIYIPGANFLIYVLTRQKTKKRDRTP
jgi:hypothetical protein